MENNYPRVIPNPRRGGESCPSKGKGFFLQPALSSTEGVEMTSWRIKIREWT